MKGIKKDIFMGDKNTLTQSNFDKLVADKYTINLSDRKTTDQIQKQRRNRKVSRIKSKLKPIMYWLLTTAFIWVLTSFIPADAHYTYNSNTNSEYEYYGVDNYKDYARMQRLEACERMQIEKLEISDQKKTLHCATIMTLITAFESDFMKSNRCMNDNNCMWLKGKRPNRSYWFLTFDNHYDWNIYFAEKWFTYHHPKSIHTLIWGYEQADWSYKYGWSTTDQAIYVAFIKDKYSSVYKDLQNLIN